MKLAAELARPDTGKTLYLLDEPTTGLHFADIVKLLEVVQRLVDLGNTVLLIEHNLDVIKAADWVIDIGPEAGWEGGRVVFAGTPEDLVEHAKLAQPSAPQNQTVQRRLLKQRRNLAPQNQRPPPSHSCAVHTGEALIPMLESAKYEDREAWDASELARKQDGDLELEQIGRDTLLPWQADGRRLAYSR